MEDSLLLKYLQDGYYHTTPLLSIIGSSITDDEVVSHVFGIRSVSIILIENFIHDVVIEPFG